MKRGGTAAALSLSLAILRSVDKTALGEREEKSNGASLPSFPHLLPSLAIQMPFVPGKAKGGRRNKVSVKSFILGRVKMSS